MNSFTNGLNKEMQKQWFTGDETYASLIENRFLPARQFPSTNLSLNIDRASYSNIRRFINTETLVPPDAVRIEEMLNYFHETYAEPEQGKVFKIRSVLTECPWNDQDQLLFINVNSRKLNLDTLPPNNLVFLIDISGSMDMPNRLPLLKAAFRLLVNNLRNKDTVAIVVYGGMAGVKLYPTSGSEKEKILKAIDDLTASGNTPGESGIRIAYNLARLHFIKGGNNRVILATDGDFNVGARSEEELNQLISTRRIAGIYLTCLGVGMGNYKDSKIQTLARKGNGNFAYLDNFPEAEKVLLTEFTQTLYAVADNVYMNVAFNPDYVKEYRLIGFDNKVGALNDTASVVEGGEIGSGNSMMVVFEINPTQFNTDAVERDFSPGTIAGVTLHYRLPNDRDWITGGPSADSKIAALQAANARLRAELSSAQLSQADEAQLSSLLRLAGRGGYRIVAASVIAAGEDYANSVTLDVGSRDGVHAQETVLNGDGLVGTVTQVSTDTSTVLLATDASSVVGARMAGSNQIGAVTGTGKSLSGPSVMHLRLFDANATLQPGQSLVTFGSVQDRPYVPGVPIGQVTTVQGNAGSLTQTALIKPFVNFTSLGVVGVVVGGPAQNPRDSVLPPSPTPVPTVTVTARPSASPQATTPAGG